VLKDPVHKGNKNENDIKISFPSSRNNLRTQKQQMLARMQEKGILIYSS
jgi:hypothetical protein